MILHKDGRIEGTATEIAEYERMQAERAQVAQAPFKKEVWNDIRPKVTSEHYTL